MDFPEEEMNPVKIIDGFPFPTFFPTEAILEALSFSNRKGDIVVTTYPKCGTTWTSAIITHLLFYGEYEGDLMGLGTKCPFLEMTGINADLQAGHSLMKSHLMFSPSRYNPEAKYIWVVRNPRDTCVSFYHHYNLMPIPQKDVNWFPYFVTNYFLKGKCLYGDYFEHTRGWYSVSFQPNVLTVVYEKMKKDPRGELIRIGEFIGGVAAERVKDEKVLDDIIKRTSLSHMKDVFNPQFSEHMNTITTLTEEEKKNTRNDFIRKGEVGDYKNYFTEQLEEKFQAWIDSDPRNKAIMKLFDD